MVVIREGCKGFGGVKLRVLILIKSFHGILIGVGVLVISKKWMRGQNL